MTGLVSINGIVSPLEQGRISVLDHGFLYGDSVYETLRTYRRRPFLLEQHLQRLSESAAALQLPQDVTPQRVREQLDRVLESADWPAESLIRIIWSRGAGELTYDPDPAQRSTLVLMARPFTETPVEVYEKGVAVALVQQRRNPIVALDPRVKTSNLLNPRLAYLAARAQGASDGIMMNVDGYLTESSRANLFLVSSGRVLTPSTASGILNGITRQLVLELCRRERLPLEEGEYPAGQLVEAEEAFLSGTTKGILPITVVDGRALGSGRPGPLTTQLMAAYDRYVAEWLDQGPSSPLASKG
ncbi:MAG: aminotransferase class IV [Candidatus Xenobia bacterium]